MDSWLEKMLNYYKKGTDGIKIIYICIISSLLFWIVRFMILKGFNISIDFFFLLSARSIYPFLWTVFTFPFIYDNLWDLLFVVTMIYFIENTFKIYFNKLSFFEFFLWGNLAGGIVFIIVNSITARTYDFLGGAVLGIYSSLFAIISYNPKMRIVLFPLPIQLPLYALGLFLITMDFLSLLNQKQGINLFTAKITAAVFGFLYMKSCLQGNDFLKKWTPSFAIIHTKILTVFIRKLKHKIVKKGEYYSKTSQKRPLTDEEFAMNKFEKQKQIDNILDKISKKGYESLTKEEKEFLFNTSKQN